MNLIALVEHIDHEIGRWPIRDRGSSDIGHVAEILVLGEIEAWVGVELANGGEVDVTTERSSVSLGNGRRIVGCILRNTPEYGHSRRLYGREILQLLDDILSLTLAVFSGPVVAQVIADIVFALNLMQSVPEHARFT